jgi:hypothetical protein
MSRIAAISVVVCVLAIAGSTQGQQYVDGYRPFRGPVAYVDGATKTILYVETDGRHVSAISLEGKVLWTRDPSADAHLKPYRVGNPKIIRIEKPLPWMLGPRPDPKRHFVAIGFDSTQTGVIDVGTGAFSFVGQD